MAWGANPGSERSFRFGQIVAVEAGAAVDVFRGDQRAQQGGGGAGIDRDFCAASQFQCFARVLRGELQRHIASHGGDGEHFQFRRCQRGEESDGIIGRRVGVEDDFHCRARRRACFHLLLSISQMTLCFTGTSRQTS